MTCHRLLGSESVPARGTPQIRQGEREALMEDQSRPIRINQGNQSPKTIEDQALRPPIRRQGRLTTKELTHSSSHFTRGGPQSQQQELRGPIPYMNKSLFKLSLALIIFFFTKIGCSIEDNFIKYKE